MRLLLCGGGSGEKTILANAKFNEMIDHNKKLLYIPLAMDKERYPSCIEWLKNEMKNVSVKDIEMVTDAKQICKKNLKDYCAIFIGGGNTFKLLRELKVSGAFDYLTEYIKNDGIVYGCSAGAIIFGKDINSCLYMDSNDVKLKDTRGFNVLDGLSLTAHYTNKNEEKTRIATDYLIKYTKDKETIYALPEEDTIYIDGEKKEFIGTKNYYIFEHGEKQLITLSDNNIEE